ncbi:MAG TPA: glycosyltransferase [Longimicrobium sp.]
MSTISVVIPSYNRAPLITATVESILAQTLPPTEVIVVDDGSSDDTAAVCARLPVRYVPQANTGLPGARNRGIREARGEWIAFCDSDDLWHPRKLELQMAALAAFPGAGWSVTGCDLIDPDGAAVTTDGSGMARSFPVFQETGVSPRDHLARTLEERTAAGATVMGGDAYGLLFEGNFGLPSSALVARELIGETGPFDEYFRWAEDTEFFHRVSARSAVAVVLDPLVLYRVHHGSMITGDPRPFIEKALESVDRAAKLRPHLSASEAAAYRRGRRTLQLRLAYARLAALDPPGARAALQAAWRDERELSPKLAALAVASTFPVPVLRGLHRVKRALRR